MSIISLLWKQLSFDRVHAKQSLCGMCIDARYDIISLRFPNNFDVTRIISHL